MNSAAAASSAARSISASVASGRPKRMLSRTLMAKIAVSCGTSAMWRRSSAGSAAVSAHAVERHRAGSRIVEAQQQVEDRALAGAGRADDGDLLARPHVKRHAVEHVGVGPRRIGEAHARRTRPRRAGAAAAPPGCAGARISRLDREQLGQPLGRARRLRQLAPDFAQLAEPARGKHREQHELAEPPGRDRARQHVLRADPEDDDDARRGEEDDDGGQHRARLGRVRARPR